MLRMYTDASTKADPGPSGVGLVFISEGLHKQLAIPLKEEMSNHEAEFEAVIAGLNYLVEQQLASHDLLMFSDSKIVVTAVERNYVKNQKFRQYLLTINQLLQHFPSFSMQWIPEAQNKEADHFARQALQLRLKANHSSS